jgi:GntR family transcriptional regulator
VVAAQALDRRHDRPLWVQLLADLRRRVEADEFAAVFPGELALVAEYGVSRHTVREALRRLRDEGLVVAGRGRAPRLAANGEIEQPLGTPYSLFSSVEATGKVQRSVVRTLDVRADGVVAARLGLEESTPLVHLERLRLADDEPLAVDRVWLPERLAAPLLDVDFSHTALYDEYAARCGIRVTGGREHLRAVVLPPAERHTLGIGSGVAAFAIDRLGCAGGRPVEWRQTLVRGDRFSVTAQFSAREGYRVSGSD